MKSTYGKLTAALITAWFVFALAAGAAGWFQTPPNLPPLPLLLSVLIPITVFTLWYFTAPGFREFALSLSPQALTRVQAWRIIGFVFIPLYAFGLLPGFFAIPTGWGDVFIGATALLAASKLAQPEHRGAFIFWQFLGIADLVIALSAGASAGFLYPNGIPTSSVTMMPLSIIPTFGVPLALILHFICIAQARRWPVAEHVTAASARSFAR